MTVKSLLVKLGVDTRELEKGLGKANLHLQKHAAEFKKAGRAMTIAGAAITGVMTGVVKAYADFDQQMTESTAIMGKVSDT
ncbi:hypothetical protein KA005_18660, partial [bacterium]|nr:hypothetical protein [bacterium]